MTVQLPTATRERLFLLYNLLKDYKEERITSVRTAAFLGVKSSRIRQDFFKAGISGGVSNGYKTEELMHQLENVLFDKTDEKKCCIVGLGRLGAALLDEDFFQNSGFKVVAGFDTSVNRVELLRSTFPLYPSFEMAYVVKKEGIETAVLCVDEMIAQSMAGKIISAGITKIVNCTNLMLEVPPEVKVVNCSVISALLKLETI